MKITDVQEAKNFLSEKMITAGILDASEAKAEVAKIVAAIPPATRASYGEDDEVAAANFYNTYIEADTANSASPIAIQETAIAANTAKIEFTAPTLAEEAMEAAMDILKASQDQKVQNTANTQITHFIIRNPKASEMLAGIKIVPETPEDKLKEYESMLVDTPENKKKFAALKEAVQSKKMVDVYMNDASRKVLGLKVTTPANQEGKTSTQNIILTNDSLIGFLVTNVLGRIPSDKTGVGCRLTAISPVKAKGSKTDATAVQGKPRVKWVGKTQAVKDPEGKMLVIANTYQRAGDKKEVKKATLRTDSFFEVYVGTETNNKGDRRVRKIRLSGKSAQVPVLKRLPEFISAFGDETDSKTISANLSAEEKQQAFDLTLQLVTSAADNKLFISSSFGAEFEGIINTITKANKAAGKNAAAGFEG